MENLTKNRLDLDTSNNSKEMDQFDWIKVFDEEFKTESFLDKLIRKTSQNPAVPIGTIATTAALSYGLWNFHKGNKIMSQYMMRARVGAQAFTILSVAIGCIYLSNKPNK
ncbi:HIG1 domain family member 2A, mitochondrial [Megachile rotundata]|uniref:HIG1 domain family member 2A, mitochondrial n=1 Tax=Megachile rotundata TaxID=143995 RepID=UPI000258F896|nr:PREDICTED: HIG1 domain family member 2A, mitochondrial [Megachile rotundata]